MTSNFLMKSIRLAALAAVSLLPAMACTFSASSPTVGEGGGNTAVQIYTQPGCSWQVTAGAAWIELYSAHSGTGTGTVYIYLPPNGPAARQGYLDVWVTGTPSPVLGGRSTTVSSSIVFRSLVTEY
jgi:hypothetical protein